MEVRLYEAALATRKEHYRDLMDRWRSIETKAQGAIATTGILVAGILAFIRELEENASSRERTLLALLLIAAAMAIIFGVAALWIRSVSEAPFAASVRPLMDVIRDSDLNLGDWRDIVREQAEVWVLTTTQLHRANQKKALLVVLGQFSLCIAVILAVVFCLLRIYDSAPVSGVV
jgi:hypothetical protein